IDPGPFLMVPLRSGNQQGTLSAWRRSSSDPFDESDLELAQLMAPALAAAVHVASLSDQARMGSRQVEAILASTDAMWGPAPFSAVAGRVANQAGRLVQGAQCLISIVPPERPNLFTIVAGSGPWAERQVGREWPWEGSVAGAAMQAMEVIETTALQSQSALAATLKDGDIDTGRLIPLTTGQTSDGQGRRSLGVIGFYRTGSVPFRPDQRALMDEFGKRVSLHLHRAELLESANRAKDRLRTGLDVTLELAAALDHRELIRRMLRRAVESVQADRASLARIDRDEMVIEDGYDREDRPFPIGSRFDLQRSSLAEQAIRTGQPQTGAGFASAIVDDSLRRLHADTRYWATVPLVTGDRVGALLMLMRRSERQFTASDLESIQLIGNAAAVALRNAQLYGMAHELSRSKSDFMNLAAHELRTPLSVISGYVSMLQDSTFGPVPAPWVKPLSVLSAKAAELGGLVEDLLVAARLEAGTMPIKTEDFDLRSAVEEALARCEPRAHLLSAEMLCLLPRSPVMVRADADHISRIMDNLLNNALTYTTETPWVRVEVKGSPDPVVTVSDRGVGIPDQYREQIFERFVRLESPTLARQPGTGLGLAISRELAERQGGRLVLLPSEVGAVFSLQLPAPGS
ncbi:MAG: GAF domain-containing sensor histidine kinase, partial [Candidatus Dormibacteraeota bacterium]|nr:GAF domain-containing sensor histidine kinase [Candidatus Dormibacteraeota bacterium]